MYRDNINSAGCWISSISIPNNNGITKNCSLENVQQGYLVLPIYLFFFYILTFSFVLVTFNGKFSSLA